MQIGIDLNIPDRIVQAIIDLDTGIIGFTELDGSGSVEYVYKEAPQVYRVALSEILIRGVASDRNIGNIRISKRIID